MLFLTEAPELDLSALGGDTIKVRAGEPLKIDLPCKGSPTPTISWSKDDKPVSPSDRVGSC